MLDPKITEVAARAICCPDECCAPTSEQCNAMSIFGECAQAALLAVTPLIEAQTMRREAAAIFKGWGMGEHTQAVVDKLRERAMWAEKGQL